MIRTEPLIILPRALIAPKPLIALFAGSFAAIWLAIEPLGLFGLVPQLSGSAGVFAYLGMFVASVLLSVIILKVRRHFQIKKIPTVDFIIESTSDGQEQDRKSVV